MPKNECHEKPELAAYEQKIRERIVVDETSPTGLRWSPKARKDVRGQPAGWLDGKGYWLVSFDDANGKTRKFGVHRVVWFLANGKWPREEIDHINGNSADNRISNLREASRSENNRNTAMRRNNTSGIKGVSFDKVNGKWLAQLVKDRKRIFLGRFVEILDAEKAVIAARERLHDAFANHGAHRGEHQ